MSRFPVRLHHWRICQNLFFFTILAFEALSNVWVKNVLNHASVAYLTHFSYCQIQAFYQIHHSYFIKFYINHQKNTKCCVLLIFLNVFFSISPSPMPFLLWCPVLTLLPIDIAVKLSSSQPDWKLLMFFSVQFVFSLIHT